MIPFVMAGSLGLLVGGPMLSVVAIVGTLAWRGRIQRSVEAEPIPPRLVMVVLLVQLRAGRSVLSALHEASSALGNPPDLTRLTRLASVVGLTSSIAQCPPSLRPLMAQLARAQMSGGSLTDTVRRLLDQDLAAERAHHLARTRSLPIRLMIPITLLMLPGMVLLLYAPSLIAIFRDLSGVWP